ncbi:helicase/relaxase domain-containing protein [Pantoea sp. JK]|uniref:helicase/relaxase domain-containing protein n=1 Tax=Pantoea sp. JK TaxID=2871703 RepID=UPI0022371B69|nr:helicase/relaxase domain-containing protein [Pantoea sp. JK]MCW6034409.1 helicase/relaxase domain-containing protein [Pantoea sp. JK]
MFSKLIASLCGGKTAAKSAPAGSRIPSGYFTPQSAAQLLSLPHRKLLMRQIWDNTSLPEDVYNRLYLAPLKKLAECVQVVPAAGEGEWSKEGGFIDFTLKFTACSVRLAKGHMFPPGAAPEEQAAKNTLWNAVVFWSALTAHLALLSRIEGELLDGRCWMPGMVPPSAPFRFRVNQADNASVATLMASRLLPDDGVTWLSGDRQAMQVMATLAVREASAMPLIQDILDKARDISGSPASAASVGLHSVTSVVSSAVTEQSQSAIILSDGGISAASALADDGTESAAKLPSDNATGQAEHPLTASEGPIALSSALSENCGSTNEQPETEKTSVDDDTSLLLSMFNAAEPATTDVNDDAEQQAPVISDDVIPVQPSDEHIIAVPAECVKLIPDAEPDDDFPANESMLDTVVDTESDKDENGDMSTASAMNEVSNPGEQFLEWIKESVNNQTLSVNQQDSLLHAVSGFMFISLPGTVFKFIDAKGVEKDRKAVQSSFEKMGILHMRNDKRFFRVKIYESEGLEGKYQKRSGYLIRLSLLGCSGKIKLHNSRYIMIEN